MKNITAVYIIRNQGILLEKSIKTISKYVMKIIIIHDGKCTDNTIKVAKKYKADIYIQPYCGQPEFHRLFAYKQVSTDWVIQLDADEKLSLNDNLLPTLAKRDDVAIYCFKWMQKFNQNYYYIGHKACFFNLKRVSFLATIQEIVHPLKNYKLINTNDVIYHDANGSHLSLNQSLVKYKKWSVIHAKEYMKPFELIPKWNYQAQNWPKPTLMRINHPITFGFIITPIYTLLIAVMNSVKEKSFVPLKIGALGALYWVMVTSEYLRLKRDYKKFEL